MVVAAPRKRHPILDREWGMHNRIEFGEDREAAAKLMEEIARFYGWNHEWPILVAGKKGRNGLKTLAWVKLHVQTYPDSNRPESAYMRHEYSVYVSGYEGSRVNKFLLAEKYGIDLH